MMFSLKRFPILLWVMVLSVRAEFSQDILPILSDTCFVCHGPDEAARKSGLRLDTEEGAFGKSKSGAPAIVAGDLEASELIRRILSTEPDEVMPPPDALRQLSDEQKTALQRWVKEGAGWGTHWAYEKPSLPALPRLTNIAGIARNAIDHFVFSRLEKEGLIPSQEANKEALIRRVTLDLLGLPPTLSEIESLLADDSIGAYEAVVDRLLRSPHYGERWAWDWLDAARYADTNGFQGDPSRTMWPWRDWVVRAFNANMPYDQFTIEQLAGDLLPEATRDQILASGFNRNHMHNGEGGRISEETRVENVFDRAETTGTIWLGATFNCCRCHDHKFDPISQKDYFSFYDFFNQTSEDGRGRGGGQAPPVLDISTPEEELRIAETDAKRLAIAHDVEVFEWKKFPRPEGTLLGESAAKDLPGNLPRYIGLTEPSKRGVDALLESVGYFKGKDDTYAGLLDQLLKAVRARDTAATNITRVMIMDTVKEQRTTFILNKGAYDKPTEIQVVAALPESLSGVVANGKRQNRLDLARWLVSKENPLTARVSVNRYWQAFFGGGLVKSVEDFGRQGAKPSHPDLLDWLAVTFMESGWDVKALHKQIVMSDTYRQSSKVAASLVERDPENRLLARGPRFRLPSWMLRDVALAASGLMHDPLGGPPMKPYQLDGIWEEATFGKKRYEQDKGEAIYRRSLYIFWRRIVGPTMFFDNSARQTCTVKKFRTNTPLHALTTLNDVTYVEAARVLGQRVLLEESTDEARLDRLFCLATSRGITAEERAVLLKRLDLLKHDFADHPDQATALIRVGDSEPNSSLEPVDLAAWASLASLVLNLDEALTKE